MRCNPRVSYRPVSEPYLPGSYWLVEARERCYIGECPTTYVDVPRLLARMRRDGVAAFIFPVGARRAIEPPRRVIAAALTDAGCERTVEL